MLFFFTILILTLLAAFYRIRLIYFSIILIALQFLFYYKDHFSNIEFGIFLLLSTPVLIILNLRNLRRRFITKYLSDFFLSSENDWKSFLRIDDGWFASKFETQLFQGKPDFNIQADKQDTTLEKSTIIDGKIDEFISQAQSGSPLSTVNRLSRSGATSLLIPEEYGGQGLSASGVSCILKNISKINPVLASIIGILNLDSLTSLLTHFASEKQQKYFLPLFAQGKNIPFLKPTSLYESIESQKSSIEGRVEQKFVNGKQQTGVRISFQDLILLGTSKSNCFFINVNLKDFNNIYSDKTHLGTAICIIDSKIKGLKYQKGLTSYNNYLYYYSCTGKDIFVPFNHIINETDGIGKGLEYLYKNQYYACNIWPLAVSIPINTTLTLTSWYFAHLQKQNGRQLLSYKIVLSKLKEQFSQCLKLQLLDEDSLNNDMQRQTFRFTAILNKNTNITQTMKQLTLLREILGSNSHNIKTESKVRTFYKVAHMATELDGMSHEINQLPLIKKAALACHPYYDKEVQILTNRKDFDLNTFDKLLFQHIGYIFHNLVKMSYYTFKTSFIFRVLMPRNKYKDMIRRMSSSFTFLSDIILINWTFKKRINTSFAGQLAKTLQQLVNLLILHNYYENGPSDDQFSKELTKSSLKNALFECQQSLNGAINLAFSRVPAILVKIMLFPLGKPYHYDSDNKPLHNEVENICKIGKNNNNSNYEYSPFLQKIYDAKQKLKAAEKVEIAVTNVTGTPLTTDNYDTLINRCLAAGIVSIEQSEMLREAYKSILEIKLTNHFGNNHEKNNYE